MKNQKQFLIEEYISSSQLTFHIDILRNKITSFFLSFAGIVSGLLFLVMENKIDNDKFNMDLTVMLTCSFIGIIGLIVVAILAKLRYVQLERFHIINNIREFQFNQKEKSELNILRDVIILNKNTLPQARLFSGTYYWLLLIIITSSFIVSIGSNFYLNSIYLSFFLGAVYMMFQHFLYFKLAKYNYKKTLVEDVSVS